ncbi:MAG: hypothetical protein R6U41_02630 [Desulfosalsimonas sp.]|uniref:hypothetical protein n=1 Tax=Desulfosalsimonas sp. TaxID=3073848 RepID=UPI003970B1CF
MEQFSINPSFFLSYANISLFLPRNIYKILSSLKETCNLPPALLCPFIKRADLLVQFSELADIDKAYRYAEELIKSGDDQEYIIDALVMVYGFDLGCDSGGCPRDKNRDYKHNSLPKELLTGSYRLRCFQCDQLYFRYVLGKIVAGESLSEIEGSIDLFKKFRLEAVPVPLKNELQYYQEHRMAKFNIIYVFAVMSLSKFLETNKRERLIKCDWCDRFDIKERKPRQGVNTYCSICTKKTKMTKAERNEYQRGWRQQAKLARKRTEKGNRIRRMMKEGWTREDAIQILKGEEEM